MKLKNQVEYQQKLFLKKGKTIITETLHLVTDVYEDGNFSMQVTEKKGYVSKSKGVHKQKLCQLQKSLQLARIIYCFQTKTPKSKYWSHKNLHLRPKWCVLTGSKMTHSVCVCNTYQNIVLLVNVVDWDLTYKDLLKLTLSCLKYIHKNLFVINFISPSFTRIFF